MIFGIGTDIIEVARVKKQVAGDSGFKEKVFTAREIAYCQTKHHQAQHYAVRFAAKEAFFKAIGTGWRGGLAFHDVEIINNDLGKPEIFLSGQAKQFAQDHAIIKIHVSLSHIKDMVNAIVILET